MTESLKTVLITGAASGLGQAVAERMALRAKHLILWDLNEAGLRATVDLCDKAPCTLEKVNLADEKAVEKAFARLEREGRTPDVIFHAAGILQTGDFDELDFEACRRMVEVNYLGTVSLVLHGARAMDAGGRILCVASIAGLKGLHEFPAYCGSKFAVMGFCEAVFHDLQKKGIALSVICPPAIDTPMVRNLAHRPVLYDIFPFAPKEKVVDKIVRAFDMRNEFLILVDGQSRLLHKANGLFPSGVSLLFERLISFKRARKNRSGADISAHTG